MDDRDTDLVAFALPRPATPLVELIADSPLGEVRTRLVTTKEKTMKTRQRDPASPARESARSGASSVMAGRSRNR